MKSNPNNMLESVVNYFTASRNERRSMAVYSKTVIVALLIKTWTIWSASSIIFPFYSPANPSSAIGRLLLLPSILAGKNMLMFFVAVSLMLITLLFTKPRYISNAIVCWIALNIFIMKYPVTNGSDYVLLVMSFLAIPLIQVDYSNAYVQAGSNAMFNLFRLLSMIQVVLIYLISAWDKLLSPVWTKGEAFLYISHMETVFNPWFEGLVTGETSAFILSWITILFEAVFVILVWKKRTRLVILCVGVIFHIGIWIMLGLPGFALQMIATYLVFLRDKDYESIPGKFRPQPL